jgi:hypothetical protein
VLKDQLDLLALRATKGTREIKAILDLLGQQAKLVLLVPRAQKDRKDHRAILDHKAILDPKGKSVLLDSSMTLEELALTNT